MAHQVNYCTSAGAGAHTGGSVANAFSWPEAVAYWNDLTSAADTHEIRVCGDVAAAAGITLINAFFPSLLVSGYSADGTTPAIVTIDGGGGAFVVINLSQIARSMFINLIVRNTDKAATNNAWSLGSACDEVAFIRCAGNDAYRGWGVTSGAGSNFWFNCVAKSNANYGFNLQAAGIASGCIALSNGASGYFTCGHVQRCIAALNTSYGFENTTGDFCTAHGNGANGFYVTTTTHQAFMECVSTSNTGYAFAASTSARYVTLLRCASYNNSTARLGVGTFRDMEPILLTSLPYAASVEGDFVPNNDATGGRLIRGTQETPISDLPRWPGLTGVDYADFGAMQSAHAYRRAAGLRG